MAELLSVVETTADGSQTVFEFNFAGGYLSRDHVKVIVFDGLDGDGNYLGGTEPLFTFLGDYTLSIPGPIPAGKLVRIYRDTPFNAPLVNFSDGSIVNEATLDRNAEQAIFAAAELRDRIGTPFDLAYIRLLQALTEADREAVEDIADLIVPFIDKQAANRPVNPCDAPFNAKGDGATNDRVPLLAALNSGRPVDLGGKTFAVLGTLSVNPALFRGVSNGTLKWLDPAAHPLDALLEVRGDIGNFVIDSLNFDIGTTTNTGGNGDSDRNALRVWSATPGVTSVKNFKVTNVYVWGNGAGSRIQIRGGSQFLAEKLFVRDGLASWSSDPTNDTMNGVDFKYCTNFTVANSQVHNLRNMVAGVPTIIHTRGFLFAECQDFLDIGNSAYKVGQGCDYSGGITPTDPIGIRGFTKVGGEYVDCAFFGIKFANCARDGSVSSVTVIRPGMLGVVISSSNVPLDDPELNTQNIDFYSVKVIDPVGYDGYACQAFRVMENVNSPTWPRGIRFAACTATDRQAVRKLVVGFASDVTYDGSSKNWNMVDPSCKVIGATERDTQGFAEYFVKVGAGADRTAANGSETSVDFDVEFEDSMNMHSLTSNVNIVTLPKAGRWEIRATTRFSQDATGFRAIYLKMAGNKVSGAEDTRAAVPFDQTQIGGVWEIDAVEGAQLSVTVYQNSGGPLVLLANSCRLTAKLIKPL